MSDLEARIAEVLAGHQKESTGMTFGSPDRCYCGQEVHTPKGDADVMDRKIGAFAAHQATMLAPVIREAQAEAWDAGWDKGWANAWDNAQPTSSNVVTSPNPYRSNDE